MEIEDRIKKVEESVKNRATTTMLSEMRKDLELRIDSLEERIENLTERKNEDVKNLTDEIESLRGEIKNLEKSTRSISATLSDLQQYTMKYEKLQKRVRALEEIMGVEEEINVNKIPPSILRLVYQYTLNDAIDSLRKYVGPTEAERIIIEVLQDVRTRTSGTELFKLKDGRIEAKDIEKAIKKKLISPKQIHLTYVEIINKIKEYMPAYIPKNFASLLRTKGQEYAIETSTENRIRIEMLERNVEKVRNDLSYQEHVLREEILETKRTIEMDMEEKSRKLEDKLVELDNRVSALVDDIKKVYDVLSKLTPYLEIIRNQIFEKIMESIPAEGVELSSLNYPDEILREFLEDGINRGSLMYLEGKAYSVEKVKGKILEALGDESVSFSHLHKKTGYSKEILDTVLENLKEEGIVEERRYGKGRKYKRR